jgi:hypothetical protein
MTYIIQANYSFQTKSQVAIYFAWQMTSGKVARFSWQPGTPFCAKPQKSCQTFFGKLALFGIGFNG